MNGTVQRTSQEGSPSDLFSDRSWGGEMSQPARDYSKYFTDDYLYLWIILVFLIPPLLFIWFPLQIYFFFFHWPKDQDSRDIYANGQIQHDWPISSSEDDNGKRGPMEVTEEEWWGQEDAAGEGQRALREEWWKRI